MKVAFYPGCVAQGACPELLPAAVKVSGKLGIELEEVVGASCTGAGVLQEKNRLLGDVLNARTFAMAERMGHKTLMVICSTCQGVMSQANYRLLHEEGYLAKVNGFLKEEGLEYKGTVTPKHLLWIVSEDVGLDKLKALVTKPLTGLKVAPFYGCYIVRPREQLGMEQVESRKDVLERVIEAVGAQVVDFSGKTRCCGFPILLINPTNSIKMVGKHTADAKAEGADAMVTPCPLCHLNLDGYQPAASKQRREDISLPVVHLPQMIGLAMGFTPREMGLQRHIISTDKALAKVGLRG